MKQISGSLFLAMLMAAGVARGVEVGTVARSTPLLQAPSAQSAVLAQVPEQCLLSILARQGAWLQVRWSQARPDGHGAATTGWVRLLDVRTAPGSGEGDSGVTQLFNVARTGASGSVVATGVRGLSKGDVQNAVPNFGEAALMDGYAVSAADAQAFAQTAPPLQARELPYVDANGAAQ